MVLNKQHVLYSGQESECLMWGETQISATKGSSLLCTECFLELECTTPAWDLPSHLRAVVAELTRQLHCVSKYQSLFPLFVLWQYLKSWARWCCIAWHKHWVRDICHLEELMQEPPCWSSLGLLSLQRNQSQNPDSSSELHANAQLQTHAWLSHKPSERNQAVKFSLSSTSQEETFWLFGSPWLEIDLFFPDWRREGDIRQTYLLPSKLHIQPFHTDTVTVHECSCLSVKDVVRSSSALLNVWLSCLLERNSCLPRRPFPCKMRSFCMHQQDTFPILWSAWGSLGTSLCSDPSHYSRAAPGQCKMLHCPLCRDHWLAQGLWHWGASVSLQRFVSFIHLIVELHIMI